MRANPRSTVKVVLPVSFSRRKAGIGWSIRSCRPSSQVNPRSGRLFGLRQRATTHTVVVTNEEASLDFQARFHEFDHETPGRIGPIRFQTEQENRRRGGKSTCVEKFAIIPVERQYPAIFRNRPGEHLNVVELRTLRFRSLPQRGRSGGGDLTRAATAHLIAPIPAFPRGGKEYKIVARRLIQQH